MVPRLGVILLTAALAGCTDLTAPPAGATRLDPIPAVYHQWWQELESCSGLSGELGRVRFFAVEGFPDDAGQWGSTAWAGPSPMIVLKWDVLDVEWIVKHEMMHALLRGPGHPTRYFRELCGNLG